MKRTILVLAACAAVAVLVVPAVAPAVTGHAGATAAAKKKKPKTVKVGVANYYYSKPKVTLRVGDKITWKWPDAGGDAHDVALTKGPKGVKKWTSPTYQAAVSWSKVFKTKGTYDLICTLHPDTMTMVVKVTK